MNRVLVSYDHASHAIKVEQNPEIHHHTQNVTLRDVKTVIKDGVRSGCGSTGKLGYFEGEMVTDEALMGKIVNQGRSIYWDGYDFYSYNPSSGQHEALKETKYLAIVGTTMVHYQSE